MKTLVACVALLTPVLASADVVEKSAGGFTIRTTFTVPRAPEAVYAAVVNVQEWWDKAHTYSGDSGNMAIAAVPGGCFCETLPGGGVQHGVVALAWPGRMLRIIGALGPLQNLGVTGAMTWQFEKAPEGTTVTFTYAVGGYSPTGLDKLAEPVDSVLMQQMRLLKAHAEKRR
jgi:hypothetical protein